MVDALRAAWRGRTHRERTALACGGLAVVLLLLYAFVWEPLRAEQKRLRAALPALRVQAAQFAVDAAEARRLRGGNHAASTSEAPRSAIESAAATVGLRPRIKSVAEGADGRFQVAVEPMPYDALVRWIGTLTSGAGVTLESVQLRPGATSGTVIVDALVLKRRGGEP
jgi:type II secretory pathway component PulM